MHHNSSSAGRLHESCSMIFTTTVCAAERGLLQVLNEHDGRDGEAGEEGKPFLGRTIYPPLTRLLTFIVMQTWSRYAFAYVDFSR